MDNHNVIIVELLIGIVLCLKTLTFDLVSKIKATKFYDKYDAYNIAKKIGGKVIEEDNINDISKIYEKISLYNWLH